MHNSSHFDFKFLIQDILDIKDIAYDPWLSRDCQSISDSQGYSDKGVKSIHG